MQHSVRTVFFGTSKFASTILEYLASCDVVDLVGVVTQPDRPVGRKKVMTAPIVKQFTMNEPALSDIQILQPGILKKETKEVLSLEPELVVVADYGQMIPKDILDAPVHKCLNVHGSYVPELRGAVPIQMTILDGKAYAGISILVMGEGLDDGPVVIQKKYETRPDDNSESLAKRLAEKGGELLCETLPDWIEGKIKPVEQDDSKATYCSQSDISKEEAYIDWHEPIELIDREVRAFYPWPVAWTEIDIKGKPKRLKIYHARVFTTEECEEILQKDVTKSSPGDIIVQGERIFIVAIDGYVELITLQVEGKQKGTAAEYTWLGR